MVATEDARVFLSLYVSSFIEKVPQVNVLLKIVVLIVVDVRRDIRNPPTTKESVWRPSLKNQFVSLPLTNKKNCK